MFTLCREISQDPTSNSTTQYGSFFYNKCTLYYTLQYTLYSVVLLSPILSLSSLRVIIYNMQTFGWLGWFTREERHCTSSSPPDVFFLSFLFYTTAGVRRKPPANWLFQRLCRVCLCDCRLYLSAPYNNNNNNTVARASFF